MSKVLSAIVVFTLSSVQAFALDLDWSGQFRAENHLINSYAERQLQTATAGSYTVPGGGSTSASFQTLFLRLRPKLVVNDNVYIKSEWWVGDPIFGLFGDGAPQSADRRQFYSNQSRGAVITAQRYWAEILSDVGTFQVGRVPLQWGLGLVWNAGDGLFDRYQSTGDAVRIISKFGSFSLIPSAVKYSLGNTVGGACDFAAGACTSQLGSQSVSDYSIILKYDNPDEDFEFGVNFIKRIAGASQDATSGYLGLEGVSAGANFNTWDLYGRKRIGRFTFAGEVPITSGNVGGIGYSAFAVALEATYKVNDLFEPVVRAGRAPGQPSFAGTRPDKFRGFFFNPNYKVGTVLFNYQLANFSGVQTTNDPDATGASLRSPFDNPITNAQYLSVGTGIFLDKWQFRPSVLFASALETAQAGQRFFNTWSRSFHTANADQESFLGTELDLGITFQMDETFQFTLDNGLFLPGGFYEFANAAGVQNDVSTIWASILRVGISF